MQPVRVGIIGGGPAGLLAAIEGAKLGLKVDLFERDTVGEHIRCAEGFFDSLHLIGRPDHGVRYKVESALLKCRREFTIDCRRISLWMIDRQDWQRSLAEEARRVGARLLENRRIRPSDLPAMREDYHWLIDASGVPSLTSLCYGFRDYYRRYGAVTCQYQITGGSLKEANCLKFAALPYYQGYYWIFPKGPDSAGQLTANVGIGWFPGAPECRQPGGHLWRKLDDVIDREGIGGRIIKRSGGLIPVRLMECLRYDNILLTGDAAGGASPLHAGGIDIACLTGALAARWIAKHAAGQDRQDYSSLVWHLLRRKLRVEEQICRLWSQVDLDLLDRLVGLVFNGFQACDLGVLLRHLRLIAGSARSVLALRSGLYHGKW